MLVQVFAGTLVPSSHQMSFTAQAFLWAYSMVKNLVSWIICRIGLSSNHAATDPTFIGGRRTAANLPLEIQREIVVTMLNDFPETLRQLNRTSKAFNAFARSVQFRRIQLLSVERLVRLDFLLSSPGPTIHKDINHLQLKFEPPHIGRRIRHGSVVVRRALSTVFHYFRPQVSLSLSLRWAISRHIDWRELRHHTEVHVARNVPKPRRRPSGLIAHARSRNPHHHSVVCRGDTPPDFPRYRLA